jgi:hypothetical protein
MVPTAHDQLTEYSPARSRRHIGQPLGRRRQAALETRSSSRDVYAEKPREIEYCGDDLLLVSNSAGSGSCTKADTAESHGT